MKKRILSVIALGWTLAWCGIAAADISNGTFTVKESKALQVMHKGDLLIEGDTINYLESLEAADEVVTGKKGKIPAVNVLLENHDTAQFRKEIALHEDGHLELTVRMRIFPYKNTPDKPTMLYSFKVPARVLDGTKFKAITGRIYNIKEVEGAFSANRKDGAVAGTSCRFISFTNDKISLVFDCDPYGLMSRGDYCRYGEPVGKWLVDKKGEHVIFSFGQTARAYGGIFAGKVLIYDGTYDWDSRHFYREWSYNGPTSAMAQFTFGTAAETKGFVNADCLPYSPEKKWGWQKPSGLTVVSNGSPDVIANCVSAAEGTANTFLLDTVPGHYMVTVRAGHNTKDIGPFKVILNGKPCADNVRVAAGKTRTLVLPTQVRDSEKQIRITLEGTAPWAIRSLVAQVIVYQNEDFTFDRDTWVIDGLFTPELK